MRPRRQRGTGNKEAGALVAEEAGVGLVEEAGSTTAIELLTHAVARTTIGVAVHVGVVDATDLHSMESNKQLVFKASAQQMRSNIKEAPIT